MGFGDKVNFYSMIGTWLGTIFTLFGLVTVIVQLRTLLRDLSTSREERVKTAAGIWAVCLPKLKRSDNGVIEGQAPSLQAWIYRHYTEAKTIAVCPYERKQFSGTSSWSQLFCRLQIFPEDLHGSEHRGSPIAVPLNAPTTADVLVDGTKISYGLPGNDFMSLLILGGFSPSEFDPKKARTVTSHLGDMHLASRGDPFSQIAVLDNSSWNRRATFLGTKWEGRYADRVNVRHCIDLALGILRFDCDQKPATLLFHSGCDEKMIKPFTDREPGHSLSPSPTETITVDHPFWFKPSAKEIVKIRRLLVDLTGGSIEQNSIYDVSSISNPEFHRVFQDRREAWGGLPSPMDLTKSQMNTIFEIAFGLNALKPWGLPPVAPKSIVNAFCPLLRQAFTDIASSSITLSSKSFTKELSIPSSTLTLISKFKAIPKSSQWKLPHRNRDVMESDLDSLAEVKTRNFLGLSYRCSLYYDAMIYVFETHNLDLEDVEGALAARCAANFAIRTAISHLPPTSGEYIVSVEAQLLKWSLQLRAFLRECLKGSPMDEIEPWACDILATYLHAWLQEAHVIEEGFKDNFRRRVFLG